MPEHQDCESENEGTGSTLAPLAGSTLAGRHIIVGVTGGIAAYKAGILIRQLRKLGADVIAVMTHSATEFVQPLTFQTLSGHPVATELFPKDRVQDGASEHGLVHISLAQWAELVLVVPATANIIGKVACGIADDLLSTLIMATTVPVIFAPAMNVNMWSNPIFVKNMNKLREYGYGFVEAEYGMLASGLVAQGRLAAIDRVVAAAIDAFTVSSSLSGKNVLVTAGRTEEDLDPVRFLTNRSTGKMGYAVAQHARRRGAEVWLVSGPSSVSSPTGVHLISVRSAADMHARVLELFPRSDIVIMAAAVADFTPKFKALHKLKKDAASLTLELERTVDIAAELGAKKGSKMLVGFVVETEDDVANARKKLEQKNWDLAVLNNPTVEGAAFGHDTNVVTLLERDGTVSPLPRMSKHQVADKILDCVEAWLDKQGCDSDEQTNGDH